MLFQDEFSRQLEKKNFKNELLRNQDDRLLTLEQSSSPESLITHALSYNNHAIIHMVIFHERNKMHWSLPCTGEKPNRILSQYLKENQFCKQQNILKKYECFHNSKFDHYLLMKVFMHNRIFKILICTLLLSNFLDYRLHELEICFRLIYSWAFLSMFLPKHF